MSANSDTRPAELLINDIVNDLPSPITPAFADNVNQRHPKQDSPPPSHHNNDPHRPENQDDKDRLVKQYNHEIEHGQALVAAELR